MFSDLNAMRQCSPIHVVHKVKSPVLLLLGDNDKRVPYSQGLQYYHALTQHRKAVSLKVYGGEGHGIVKVQPEADAVVTSMLFFLKYDFVPLK
jgi:acylaminoacyl-peptidase